MTSEWEWKRLGNHCQKIGSGATPTGGKDVYLEQGPFALFRSQNVYNDGFTPTGLAYIGEGQAKKLDGVAVQELDVLLNITGDSVARVCLAPSQYLPARVNQHVAIIRPDPADLDSRFLRYFLASPYQQDVMLGLAAAGATRSALTKGMIEAFTVPFPPIHEQRAIADSLSVLDDRIANLRETNATLESIAQVLFKSWFVDFDPVHAKQQGFMPAGMEGAMAALFPDSFEESALGLVPKGWRAGSLADLADLNSESWSGRIHPQRIAYVDLANAKNNEIVAVAEFAFDDAPSRARRVLRTGDTIVGTVRPGNRSFAFVHEPMSNLTASTGFAVLRPRAHENTAYVYLAATQDSSIEHLAHVADGGAYPAVRPDVVSALACAEPPCAILKMFDAVARPLLEKVSANQAQAQTLATLRDTLLPRLISGQLRLPDADVVLKDAA